MIRLDQKAMTENLILRIISQSSSEFVKSLKYSVSLLGNIALYTNLDQLFIEFDQIDTDAYIYNAIYICYPSKAIRRSSVYSMSMDDRMNSAYLETIINDFEVIAKSLKTR